MIACNPTLSHSPVFERPGGRVLNRVSSNRNGMCRTELKCRSVLARGDAVGGVIAGVLTASEVPTQSQWRASSVLVESDARRVDVQQILDQPLRVGSLQEQILRPCLCQRFGGGAVRLHR